MRHTAGKEQETFVVSSLFIRRMFIPTPPHPPFRLKFVQVEWNHAITRCVGRQSIHCRDFTGKVLETFWLWVEIAGLAGVASDKVFIL
jgi:hypothetical protein